MARGARGCEDKILSRPSDRQQMSFLYIAEIGEFIFTPFFGPKGVCVWRIAEMYLRRKFVICFMEIVYCYNRKIDI